MKNLKLTSRTNYALFFQFVVITILLAKTNFARANGDVYPSATPFTFNYDNFNKKFTTLTFRYNYVYNGNGAGLGNIAFYLVNNANVWYPIYLTGAYGNCGGGEVVLVNLMKQLMI